MGICQLGGRLHKPHPRAGDRHALVSVSGQVGSVDNFPVRTAGVAAIVGRFDGVKQPGMVRMAVGQEAVGLGKGAFELLQRPQEDAAGLLLVKRGIHNKAALTSLYNVTIELLERVAAQGKLHLINSGVNLLDFHLRSLPFLF